MNQKAEQMERLLFRLYCCLENEHADLNPAIAEHMAEINGFFHEHFTRLLPTLNQMLAEGPSPGEDCFYMWRKKHIPSYFYVVSRPDEPTHIMRWTEQVNPFYLV